MSECSFTAPCRRYMGMLADRDELQREIERLRAYEVDHPYCEADMDMHAEALRLENKELRADLHDFEEENKRLHAENNRLRAALISIGLDCKYPDCDGGPSTGYCREQCRELRAEMDDPIQNDIAGWPPPMK